MQDKQANDVKCERVIYVVKKIKTPRSREKAEGWHRLLCSMGEVARPEPKGHAPIQNPAVPWVEYPR